MSTKHSENPHSEDIALDSMLRSLGKSDRDGREFTDAIVNRLSTDEFERTPLTSKKRFFEFGSLVEEAGIAGETNWVAEDRNSSANANWNALRSSIAAVCCVGLIAGAIVFYFNHSPNFGNDSIANEAAQVSDPSHLNSALAVKISRHINSDSGSTAAALEDQKQLSLESKNESTEFSPLKHLVFGGKDPADLPPGSEWTISIEFEKTGEGSVTLNGKELNARIKPGVGDLVIRKIGTEVLRRFRFLQPCLDSIHGSLAISTNQRSIEYPFTKLAELNEAVARGVEDVRRLGFAIKSNTASDQFQFTYPVVDEVISETEAILQTLASRAEPPPPEIETVATGSDLFEDVSVRGHGQFKWFRSINADEFAAFLSTGVLKVPAPEDAFRQKTIFATLDSQKLRTFLADVTRTIDLFNDIGEFEANQELIDGQSPRRLANRVNEEYEPVLVDLRKQIANASSRKQRRLLQGKERQLKEERSRRFMATLNADRGRIEPIEPLLQLLPERNDLDGIDFVMGEACHLNPNDAETLDHVSKSLGGLLAMFDRFASRDFSEHTEARWNALKAAIHNTARHKNRAQALSTLDQMLLIEQPKLRLELVRTLLESNCNQGVKLLTCYAKYDLDPSVRAAATEALSYFNPALYRSELIDGLRYPWPEVAMHSAEALTRLNDEAAAMEIVELLKKSDPRIPERNQDGHYVKKELVAINHMKNCTLCHADSQSKFDHGRGVIPKWGQPLREQYYLPLNEAAVRADITYLRQDFSAIQRVKNSDPWPENQRFDYVVQARPISKELALNLQEEFKRRPDEYRAIVHGTLVSLTGEKANEPTFKAWQKIVAAKYESAVNGN